MCSKEPKLVRVTDAHCGGISRPVCGVRPPSFYHLDGLHLLELPTLFALLLQKSYPDGRRRERAGDARRWSAPQGDLTPSP